VSTGIGSPFLQSSDVLATAAGSFSDILATFSFLTATCDLLCFLLTGVFFFGADLKNLDYLSQKKSNVKTKKKAQLKPPFKSTKEAKADVQNYRHN
jgi:hypothetical protein